MRLRVLVLLFAASFGMGVAFADAPAHIPVQGYLSDAQGVAINDVFAVTFTLYTDATGTNSVWTEEAPVNFVEGQFTSYLGASTALDLALFRDNGTLYLGVKVASDVEMTPFEVATVPFAAFAQHSASASSLDDAFKLSFIDDVAAQLENDAKVHTRYEDSEAVAAVIADGRFVENSGTITLTGNVTITGTLTTDTVPTLPYGESRANPALNCNDLLQTRVGLADGVYWLKPSSARAAFQAYCDMTTDNGGWTLVWSNLRGSAGKTGTQLQWGAAINTLPQVRGQLTTDTESFDVYTGLAHWLALSPNATVEFRYDWAADYGRSLDQSYKCEIDLDAGANYRLTLGQCSQLIGTVVPGIVGYSGLAFSTYDRDNDTRAGSCSALYSKTPWWYGDCWSGQINGGGEFTGNGHFNGAYWRGSAGKWGDPADADGAGNGWMYIK